MPFNLEILLRQQNIQSSKQDKAFDYSLTNMATEIRARRSEKRG
jgi:hypothetical protein